MNGPCVNLVPCSVRFNGIHYTSLFCYIMYILLYGIRLIDHLDKVLDVEDPSVERFLRQYVGFHEYVGILLLALFRKSPYH